MIGLVKDEVIESITKIMKERGINITSSHNTDLDLIDEYSKTLRFTDMFDKDVPISSQNLEILKKHNLLLYNFSPLTKSTELMQGSDFEAEMNEIQKGVPTKDGITKSTTEVVDHDAVYDFFVQNIFNFTNEEGRQSIKSEKRDVLIANFKINCMLLFTDENMLNIFQFLYLRNLYPRRVMQVSIDFGTGAEAITMAYDLIFEELEEARFINPETQGSLQGIRFSLELKDGVFVSPFSKSNEFTQTIELSLGFID